VRTRTNVDLARTFIRQDRHSTVKIVADLLNINECAVHHIVTRDWNTGKLCAKVVAKNLNNGQKARRNEVSAEMLELLETESNLLDWVIIFDVSRFFEYDPDTQRQSEEGYTPPSPRQKKALMSE
jgi:hypothetical protein